MRRLIGRRVIPAARHRWTAAPFRHLARLQVTPLEVRDTPATAFFATGAAAGSEPFATVYRPDGIVLARFLPYDDGFRGGVHTAVAEMDGDPNTIEVVTGPGAGGGPHVEVFRVDTTTGAVGRAASFLAYDPAFTGGVEVAAGDLDGDGIAEIVTGPGNGGGPHVEVFGVGAKAEAVTTRAGFLAYDPAFRGGVYVAVGGFGPGIGPAIVTGAGAGGGPVVRVLRLSAGTAVPVGGPVDGSAVFDPGFRGGVSVAAGELDGDTADGDELAVGAGPTGGPHVRILRPGGKPWVSFMAFDPASRGGVDVAGAGPGRLIVRDPSDGQVDLLSFRPDAASTGVVLTPPDPLASAMRSGSAATTPMALTDGGNDYWLGRQAQIAARAAQGHANVVFLGDSITDFLESGAGQPVWQSALAPLGAVDFAVSGVTTSQLLWQVETGQVAAVTPDVVVLQIGTNNLGQGQTPLDTAAGIATIVSHIVAQLPRTRILLLGILPRGQSPSDPLRLEVAEVNRLLATRADGRLVRYLDVGPAFLQPDGTISPAVMPDFLHPSALGYQIFTSALMPSLQAALHGG